ncbi:MAG TPA: hypothetical protein VGM80_07520 [Gaiellaceae bacterium]|jgi:hypothetical protein
MSQTAALYTVTIRPRSKQGAALPLGDIDGAGTSLSIVLASILGGLSESSKDGTRVVRTLAVQVDGDDLFAVLQHGGKGIAADIVDPAGGVRLHQRPGDLQLLRCGCLFRLPPAATVGALAVQVVDGQGVKELFQQGVIARFRAAFPQLTLLIDRLAEPDALRRAVSADHVEHLRLIRIEPGSLRASPDTGKWVAAGTPARVAVEVGGAAPGTRIRRELLERYLAGDDSAFTEIVTFAGMTFDRASVGVVLPDSSRRIYDLEHPASGRPAANALPTIELDDTGEPTDAGLLAALRSVIAS